MYPPRAFCTFNPDFQLFIPNSHTMHFSAPSSRAVVTYDLISEAPSPYIGGSTVIVLAPLLWPGAAQSQLLPNQTCR